MSAIAPSKPEPIAPADYVAAIREALAGFGGRIVLEPGRFLSWAEAGVLMTRVVAREAGESGPSSWSTPR